MDDYDLRRKLLGLISASAVNKLELARLCAVAGAEYQLDNMLELLNHHIGRYSSSCLDTAEYDALVAFRAEIAGDTVLPVILPADETESP